MKKNKKGFTIVELVIVIAVIGILAAVLIPTFTNVVENSRKTAVQEEARNAIVAYIAENEGVIDSDIDASADDNWTYYTKENDAIYVYSDQTKYKGYIVVFDKSGNFKEVIAATTLDTTSDTATYKDYTAKSFT